MTKSNTSQTQPPVFVHLPVLRPSAQQAPSSFNMSPFFNALPLTPMSEDGSSADHLPEFTTQNSAYDSDKEVKGSPLKKAKLDTPSRAKQSPNFDTPSRAKQSPNQVERTRAKLQPVRLNFQQPDFSIEGDGLEEEGIIPTFAIQASDSDSGDELRASPPKKTKLDLPPRTPFLRPIKLKLDLSQRYENPEESSVKGKEEFAWMNRLIMPRVLGRPLNNRERNFVQQVQEAADMGKNFRFSPAVKIGIEHLQRGTYLIRSLNAAVSQLLAYPAVSQCIAEYSGMREEAFIKANIFPIAVFKPADEVRGAPNAPKREHGAEGVGDAAKPGILSWLEIPNEVIAAGLSDLNQMVVGMSLTNARFNDVSQGNKEKTKYGVAISFMPMTSLTKISNTSLLNKALETMPLRDFQKMAILDLRLCNTDRNRSNIMLSNSALQRFIDANREGRETPSLQEGEICLIDQANILPKEFSSSANFAWMQWENAHLPFDEASKQEIAALDLEEDIAKIKDLYPNYPQENLDIMRVTYHLLKEGARNDLTPFQIGLFFSAPDELPSCLSSLFQKAQEVRDAMPAASSPQIHALINSSLTKTIEHALAHPSDEVWNSSFSFLTHFAKDQIK